MNELLYHLLGPGDESDLHISDGFVRFYVGKRRVFASRSSGLGHPQKKPYRFKHLLRRDDISF